MVSSSKLWSGFRCLPHGSFPPDLFNGKPQRLGLDRSLQRAYTFAPNVVLTDSDWSGRSKPAPFRELGCLT